MPTTDQPRMIVKQLDAEERYRRVFNQYYTQLLVEGSCTDAQAEAEAHYLAREALNTREEASIRY